MSTRISPLAGQPAPKALLIDADQLVAAYFSERPDPSVPAQRVAFGTSGHRGSAFDVSFNEWHVLAITQALCDHRRARGIAGPLFMGVDTHALSAPACASALEVLAANGVETMLAINDEPTPAPAVSHAILTHNRGGAEGIVVTPSHNPPRDGGFKFNPPHGGPAGADITDAIQAAGNRFLENGLDGVRRVPHARALAAATTHRHDYLGHYVAELDQVIDLDAIRNAKSGWYAARPSGTEDIYKIYAESFQGVAHLQRILVEAQATVDAALALPSTAATTSPTSSGTPP